MGVELWDWESCWVTERDWMVRDDERKSGGDGIQSGVRYARGHDRVEVRSVEDTE